VARKKYDDTSENHERWLISYADFITLLFAFFVVMYAISSVNEEKYRQFSDSLGSALAGRATATVAVDAPLVQPRITLKDLISKRKSDTLRRERALLKALAADLSDTLAPLVKEGKVRVTQNSRGVTVDINASVLFDPGDATLTPDSMEALRALAGRLKDDTHAIAVEGHTDGVPIATPLFASNWELSAVRASSVVRLFVDSGLDSRRLSAVGNADNVPVAGNDTPEGRARNRRVTVTILSAVTDTTTEIPTR
jgi:chemotaxis protein MotB